MIIKVDTFNVFLNLQVIVSMNLLADGALMFQNTLSF